jgi:hypothetical protein
MKNESKNNRLLSVAVAEAVAVAVVSNFANK